MNTATVCPKTGAPCDFCSNEVTRITTRTGDIVSGIKRTVKTTPKGEFCNNDGRHFVADLDECPIPAALAVPLVPRQVSELEWMQIQVMRRS